jgi:hypothetical protein
MLDSLADHMMPTESGASDVRRSFIELARACLTAVLHLLHGPPSRWPFIFFIGGALG